MSTPNHRHTVPTLQHLHTQLLEIDPSLRSATRRTFALPAERVALDKINATLKTANASYLSQARALYLGLDGADLAQAAGQQLLTRLKTDLHHQLQTLDGTARIDHQSRKTYLTFTAGINALEQQAQLSVNDYLLTPSDQRMVEDSSRGPSFRPGQYALSFTYQDQRVAFAGAFVLTRQSSPTVDSLSAAHSVGPVLLFTPARGLEAFESLHALDQGLHTLLAQPAGREEFSRLLPVRYQALDAEDMWPLALHRIDDEPLFEHVYSAQLDKRRQDIDQALRLATNAADLKAQLDAAIEAILPDLTQRLDLREQQLQERALYHSLPDWYRIASLAHKQTFTAQLRDYNHARQTLLELFEPATTPHALARHQLVEQLADELDIHTLDPDRLHITTQRTVPAVGRYAHRRSLVELSLRGLHDGDALPGSDFLSRTTLTYDARPLPAEHADLTPQALINLLADLQPHQDFAALQNARLGNPEIKEATRAVCDRRLVALAGMARLQGHLSQGDHGLFEQLRATPAPHLRAQTVLLHGAQLTDLWLLREEDSQGEIKRVLLCTPGAPRAQQFIAFNSLRECQAHIIGWVDSPSHAPGRSMAGYLLEQVPQRFRRSMQRFLQGISLKPQAQEYQEVTFGRSCSYADCLEVFASHLLSVQRDDYEHGAPPWFRACPSADRRRLNSLAQDARGALDLYNDRPDSPAQFPAFEAYLHEKAKLSLNTLLGRRQNDVDPDTVFAYAPSTLIGQTPTPVSYTTLYRDGYEDGIGFLDAKFSTSATFRGPDGVDLSPLTAQSVARAVTGVWIGQRYTDDVRRRLLAADSPGYGARRNAVLAIQQLQMKGAALESRYQGAIASIDLAWLERAIDSFTDNSPATRSTYKVHRLFIDGDWVLGNYLFSYPNHPTLLYTPNAPDGIAFREARLFNYLLKRIEGMPAYWCSRVPVQSTARINRFLEEAHKGLPHGLDRATPSPARHDPIAHVTPLVDLRHEFYDMPLQRKIDDVQATTVNRTQMITHLVWTTVEWVTAIATIPFPVLSLALGGLLAFKDAMLALNAYHQGDREAALQHFLGYLANIGGAVLFDFRPALSALRPPRVVLKTGTRAQESALLQQLDSLTPEGMQRVLFDGQALWARQTPDALGRYLLYRHDPLTGQLHSTARLANRNSDGAWVRSGVAGGGRKRYEKLLEDEPNPLSAYDIAPQQSADFRTVLDPELRNAQLDWGDDVAGAARYNAREQLTPLRDAYDGRVRQLTQDTQRFLQSPPTPSARPVPPALAPDLTATQIINGLFLRDKRLIIGAADTTLAGKALLIDALPELARNGLKRLYIEHLPRDLFHRKLKVLNNELKGNPAKALQRIEAHLERVDRELGLTADSPFTYRRLVHRAHAEGIAIEGLDGTVSYHMEHVLALTDGPRFIPRANTLRNFYTHTLIEHNARKAPEEGWLALVDQSRLGSHEHIPGLAELQNTLSLRVDDVAPGQPTGLSPDTLGSGLSRGDLRLAQTATPPSPALPGLAPQTSDPVAASHFATFDIPPTHRRLIAQMAGEQRALDTHYHPGRTERIPAFQAFTTLRHRLQDAATQAFANYQHVPRPSLAHLATASSETTFIERVYAQKQGLVIGEAHLHESSKRFLIKYMKLLKKQGVKTLYIEHVLTDLHQEALNTFQTTLKMPASLESYLRVLDRGHMPTYRGSNTFTNVIKAANKQGLRVRALDCTASYHIKGLSGEHPRHWLFSYFANEVIKADQLATGPHKWVAFIGSSHTDMHVLVPGIADLQDAISLHVRDVPMNLARPIESSGWEATEQNLGVALRSDFKLMSGVQGLKFRPETPGPNRSMLTTAGEFLIERPSTATPQLVHKSRTGEIVTTPIQISEKGQYFIERWDVLKNERFVYLNHLIEALKAKPPKGLGMKPLE